MNKCVPYISFLQVGASPTQREHTLSMRSSAESMMRILNDVLSLQKIHEGKFEILKQPMEFVGCLRAVAASMRAAAEASGLRLAVEADDAFTNLWVLADGTRITQARVCRRASHTVAREREKEKRERSCRERRERDRRDR